MSFLDGKTLGPRNLLKLCPTDLGTLPCVALVIELVFSTSVEGVNASANLYSLIETTKANGLEPYAYLRYLFAELPKAGTVDAIEALLPGNLNPEQIKL